MIPDPDAVSALAQAPANAIPDHDPFTDTDVLPDLGQRPSTGGFAGLSRSTGEAAGAYPSSHRSPISPSISPTGGGVWPTPPRGPGGVSAIGAPSATPSPAPPGIDRQPGPYPPIGSDPPTGLSSPSGPTNAESAGGYAATAVMPVTAPSSSPAHPPANPAHDAASFPSAASLPLASNPAAIVSSPAVGSGHPFGPPGEGSTEVQQAAAGAGAWTAPPEQLPLPHSQARPARPRFGKGPVVTLAVLAGVVLLGLGALGGALLNDRADNNSDLAAGGSTNRTTETTVPSPTTREPGQTSRTQPTQPTTSAGANSSPTSTVLSTTTVVPTTVAPAAPAAPADPNALVADFSWTPESPAPGQSITITDASTGNPKTWTWRWNGNTVSSSQPKGFTTSLREDTAITLTVCRGNGSGNCASVTKTITVG